MSTYDSAVFNANPNDTQVPARHDDLPAPAGNLNRPFQPVDTTQHQTRSGGADYPYTTGGDRPQPASENPRWNAPTAATSNTEERPGVLDYKSGADTYGAAGTGNASSGNGPAERLRGGSQGFGDSDRDLRNVTGIDTEPVHRLHSQNDPLPRPSGQESGFGYGTTSSDEPPVHRLHSENEALPRPSGGFDSNDKYGEDSADTDETRQPPGAWTDDGSSDGRDDAAKSAMQAVGNTLSSAVTTAGSMAANYLPDSVVGQIANYAPGIVPQSAKGLDEVKNSSPSAPDVNESNDRSLNTFSDSKSVDNGIGALPSSAVTNSSGPSRDTSLPSARSPGGSTDSETDYKSIGEKYPSFTTGEAGLGAESAAFPATHGAQGDTSFSTGSERDASSYGTDSNRDASYGSANKLGTSFGTDSQRDTSHESGTKPDTSYSTDSNQATSHGSDIKHNTSYGSSNQLDTSFGTDSQRDTYQSDHKPHTSYSVNSNQATSHGSDIKHNTSYGSSNQLDTSYSAESNQATSHGSDIKHNTSYGSSNKLDTSFSMDSQRDTHGSDTKRDDTYGSDTKRDTSYGADTKRDISHSADSNRDTSYGSDSKRGTSLGTDRQSDSTYGTDNKRDTSYGTDNKSNTYGTDNKREGFSIDARDNQSADYAGRDNHPTGHASMTDKLIGKTQQVVGKMTSNPGMQEKGELRKTAGKEAVRENYSAQS